MGNGSSLCLVQRTTALPWTEPCELTSRTTALHRAACFRAQRATATLRTGVWSALRITTRHRPCLRMKNFEHAYASAGHMQTMFVYILCIHTKISGAADHRYLGRPWCRYTNFAHVCVYWTMLACKNMDHITWTMLVCQMRPHSQSFWPQVRLRSPPSWGPSRRGRRRRHVGRLLGVRVGAIAGELADDTAGIAGAVVGSGGARAAAEAAARIADEAAALQGTANEGAAREGAAGEIIRANNKR